MSSTVAPEEPGVDLRKITHGPEANTASRHEAYRRRAPQLPMSCAGGILVPPDRPQAGSIAMIRSRATDRRTDQASRETGGNQSKAVVLPGLKGAHLVNPSLALKIREPRDRMEAGDQRLDAEHCAKEPAHANGEGQRHSTR